MSDRGTRVAILSIEGTNCDEELATCFRMLGAYAEIVDLKQFTKDVDDKRDLRRLSDYQILMVPGGFSAGDYVRAGAIMAARIKSSLGGELRDFVRTSGNLVGGICNGFQVLVELGLLPGGKDSHPTEPQVALATNSSAHFECRPTYCRWEGGGFLPLKGTPPGDVYYFPSAHGEGKFTLSGKKGSTMKDLEENGQILFRWVDPTGNRAGYPWNPNGSDGDVAGVTNLDGNIFGLMPHPERSFSSLQSPNWTRTGIGDGKGDGYRFFESILQYALTRK
jgi:phosphoribosylformylglycinamidine synthase